MAEVTISPGKYVVAVSGGVDSMALLHWLVNQTQSSGKKDRKLRLVVAHFDHGMRADSSLDRQLVEQTAKRYGLPFVYARGELGEGASEAEARHARYRFLHQVRRTARADALITAHHQDDVLETAIINLMRGTGRKGLSSMHDQSDILRPFLNVPKHDILKYATKKGVSWREDSTNADTRYLRNHIRHVIMPRLRDDQRQALLGHIRAIRGLNQQIDTAIINHLHNQPRTKTIDRHWFTMLPHDTAREVMAGFLREQGIRNFDRRLLEKAVTAAKTFAPNKRLDVSRDLSLTMTGQYLALGRRER